VAIYTGAKALSRWPINDESTLTDEGTQGQCHQNEYPSVNQGHLMPSPSTQCAIQVYLHPMDSAIPALQLLISSTAQNHQRPACHLNYSTMNPCHLPVMPYHFINHSK
jgi:hypothetical protein